MSLLAEKAGNTLDADLLFEEARAEIIAGLSATRKTISPKYFYDEKGSRLFDRICTVPEYYPTRTEHKIMQTHLPEISGRIGPGAAVIEFGAGSNDKARQLLRHLDTPAAYVPVEISGEYLADQASKLQKHFPALSIKPVVADFTRPFDLPGHPTEPARNLVFFPGSTIGNFQKTDAGKLLEVMRFEAKPGGALLIGVDLIKDVAIVEPAYNDSQGVTAAFNLNVLRHINNAIGADFDISLFEHRAIYDAEFDRIEMRLVSVKSQTVNLDGEVVSFEAGEHIVTEHSHKYSIESFQQLAARAGWQWEQCWTDDDQLFSVHFLTAP